MRVFTEKLSESFYNTKKYQKLYLIDFDAALSRCGFEFIDILAKAFGVCPRCVQLYNHFGSAYFYKGNFQLVRYVPGAARGFMYSLINMFGEQRGLESFRNFLLGNSIDEQGFATSSKSWAVPIPYMYKCLQAFERIRRELEFTMRRELGEIVFKAIKNRITNLTEKEVKEINPSAIIKLLDLTTSYISDTEFMGDLRRLLLIYILDKLMN